MTLRRMFAAAALLAAQATLAQTPMPPPGPWFGTEAPVAPAPTIEESTGRVTYDYVFELPRARGRYQPALSLAFATPFFGAPAGAAWQGPCGAALVWDFYVPYMTFDGSGGFWLWKHGSAQQLMGSQREGFTFVPKASAEYLSFTRPTVTTGVAPFIGRDAAGNTYTFIYASTTAAGSTWRLDRVVDLDGNITQYGYAGNGLITSIKYNAYRPADPTGTSGAFDPSTAAYATIVTITRDASGYRWLGTVQLQVAADPTNPDPTNPNSTTIVRTWNVTGDSYGPRNITEWGGVAGPEKRVTTIERAASGAGLNCLSAVVTPLGARYDVGYDSSQTFGDAAASAYAIGTSLTVTGPALATGTTTYWYSTPVRTPTGEYRGFAQSWSQDATTTMVQHTYWETGSSSFAGWPARREWATAYAAGTATQPPKSGVSRFANYEHSAKSIATGACSLVQYPVAGGAPVAQEPASTSYPVLLFTQFTQDTNQTYRSMQFTSTRAVSCGDIDQWGNVTKVAVDPDVALTGNKFFDQLAFVADSIPTAPCKDCVQERLKYDPQGNLLEASKTEYDTNWRVINLYRKSDSFDCPNVFTCRGRTYPTLPSTAWSWYGNGNLASKTEAGVSYSSAYDTYFQLRVASTQTRDADAASTAAALVTSTLYDSAGRPSLVTGPQVIGSGAIAAQRSIAYDSLGRPRIVARAPMSGASVTGALLAYTYTDFSANAPAATTTYAFSTPQSYTDPNIPQTSDVRQTVSYVDGLGREIQVRERLGGVGTGDPAAQIAMNLTGYRVAKAILYDGAGRTWAALEPYYSTSGSFVDLSAAAVDASSGTVHATFTSYSGFDGTPTCVARRYVGGTLASLAALSCVSSFAENSSYARATALTFDSAAVGAQNYLIVKSVPPENNVSPGGAGTTSYYDASGRLQFTMDAEGSIARVRYDALGRTLETRREAGGYANATTFVVDLMGRVSQRIDPNIGTQSFVYDPATGLLARAVLKTGQEIRFAYDKGRIYDVCTASGPAPAACTVDSSWRYDEPYVPAAGYDFTAGRLSWARNSDTTIAFGYSENGALARRDQWLPGMPTGAAGVFSAVDATTWDGRVLRSDLTTPVSTFSSSTAYDSAGRPVRLTSGATTYWDATGTTAATGAFDAMGRLGSVVVDDGRVSEAWTFGSNSAMLSSQNVQISGAPNPVYSVSGMTWRGTKLSGFTDSLTQTTWQYWYSGAGRLNAAKATAGGALPLSQNGLTCLSYVPGATAFGPGPSLGNVELVRASGVTQDYLYAGTGVEASIPPAGPDAVTSLAFSSGGQNVIGHDGFGRVTSTNGGAETYTYDLFNRLTTITRTTGTNEVMRYDPFGLLLSRQSGASVTYYLGESATVTGTLSPGCQTPACGIAVASLQVDVHLTVDGERMASVRQGSGAPPRTIYLYRDRLGSVVATSLAGGVAGAGYRYGARGSLDNAAGDSGDAAAELGYGSALRLSGGLLMIGLRVYDPRTATFLQPDPVQPFGYGYASGDPINRVDPSGSVDYACRDKEKCDSQPAPPPPDPDCPPGACESITVTGQRKGSSGWNSAGDRLGGTSAPNYGGVTRGSIFWNSLKRKTVWNFRVTTNTMVSPLTYLGRLLAGNSVDWWDAAMGAGFYEALATAVAAGLTAGGVQTIMGYITSEVIDNAGLPVSLLGVAGGVGALYIVNGTAVTVTLAVSVAVGSAVEALAETTVEEVKWYVGK